MYSSNKVNLVRTTKTKARFNNETKADRKANHKAMQQSRKLARQNKAFNYNLSVQGV